MTFRTIALTAAVIGLVPGCASMHRAPYQPPLLNPRGIEMNQTAPATFRVRFETTKGDVVIEAHREWAPHGVDRFYNLVNGGFFADIRFFRVIDRFMAQFGIHGDPAVSSVWSDESIPDDPVVASNVGGLIESVTEETGLRCEPGDIDGIVAAVEGLLSDPERGKRLARAGRERVVALYSDRMLADDTMAVYERVLRKGSAPA